VSGDFRFLPRGSTTAAFEADPTQAVGFARDQIEDRRKDIGVGPIVGPPEIVGGDGGVEDGSASHMHRPGRPAATPVRVSPRSLH
jgi:hypothetical protein